MRQAFRLQRGKHMKHGSARRLRRKNVEAGKQCLTWVIHVIPARFTPRAIFGPPVFNALVSPLINASRREFEGREYFCTLALS